MPARATSSSAPPPASRRASISPRSTDRTASASTGSTRTTSSGSSVAGAGDVNGDGFDDLIVGAPAPIRRRRRRRELRRLRLQHGRAADADLRRPGPRRPCRHRCERVVPSRRGFDFVTTGGGTDTVFFDDLAGQRDVLTIADFDPLADTLDLRGAAVAETLESDDANGAPARRARPRHDRAARPLRLAARSDLRKPDRLRPTRKSPEEVPMRPAILPLTAALLAAPRRAPRPPRPSGSRPGARRSSPGPGSRSMIRSSASTCSATGPPSSTVAGRGDRTSWSRCPSPIWRRRRTARSS